MKLQLSLKRKWFEMTKAGIKTEDYREINEYWFSRFMMGKLEEGFTLEQFKNHSEMVGMMRLYRKSFKINRMTLGYPKSTDTEKIIEFEHAGIEIRTGNPEWGAEPNKLYFVIKHGKRL